VACWNGWWVPQGDAPIQLGSKKRDDWTTPAELQVSTPLFLCGQIQLTGPREILDGGSLTVAGTLTLASGGIISFPTDTPYLGHGQVFVTDSCGAPGVDQSNNAEFIMQSGSTVRFLGFNWDDLELEAGGLPFQTFITVGQCADCTAGTFHMEAPIIPPGTNTFPIISAGCQVYNDPEWPFANVELDLDGGCSNVLFNHHGNGTWGDVWLTLNRKDTCSSTIVALAVCLPALAALVVLGIFALSGGIGGGSGGDDYVGL